MSERKQQAIENEAHDTGSAADAARGTPRTAPPCCSPTRQATCCAPSDKAACCGVPAAEGSACGCRP